MYTIYVNNTLALAVHEIYRDIFGPPMVEHKSRGKIIGFLVTIENINRNEHITPVFKITISNPNYWNLAAGFASTWTCRLSIASEIPEM